MLCNYIFVFIRWIYVNLIDRAQVHMPKMVDSLFSSGEGTSWASLKQEGQIIILLIITIIIFPPYWLLGLVESQGSCHCVRWFTLVAPSTSKCYCHTSSTLARVEAALTLFTRVFMPSSRLSISVLFLQSMAQKEEEQNSIEMKWFFISFSYLTICFSCHSKTRCSFSEFPLICKPWEQFVHHTLGISWYYLTLVLTPQHSHFNFIAITSLFIFSNNLQIIM